jgi:hypothetical protein
MRRALVVGINDYQHCKRLYGCERDAHQVASALETNGDGSPNFDVRILSTDQGIVEAAELNSAIHELFAAEADVALLYFAGHGAVAANKAGWLVASDGREGAFGVSLGDLIQTANAAHKKIRSTIIILDACHSGAAADAPGILADDVAAVGKGVIVLSAAHKDGYAEEQNGQGVFSTLLVEGLLGSASDVLGNITPASVYSLVDQTLGPWEQRPIFKANVQSFVRLRTVPPKIALETLRKLPIYFPDETHVFPLDPAYEPDRNNIPVEFRDLPIDETKTAILKELQNCNRHGLIVPVDAEHMYDAAITSTGCRLTALGAHYRRLAESRRF